MRIYLLVLYVLCRSAKALLLESLRVPGSPRFDIANLHAGRKRQDSRVWSGNFCSQPGWPEVFAWPHKNKRESGDTIFWHPRKERKPELFGNSTNDDYIWKCGKHCPTARYYDSLSPSFKEKLIVKLFTKEKWKTLQYFVLIYTIFDIDLNF